MNTEDILKQLTEIKNQLSELKPKPKPPRVKREPTAKQIEQRNRFKAAMQNMKATEEQKTEVQPPKEPKRKPKKKDN